MVRFATQLPSAGTANHLVLYDGVCGLCNRLLQFLLRHDHRRVFTFASLQSPIGRLMVERTGGSPDELASFYVFASYRTGRSRVFTRSEAALFVASELGWPWKVVSLMHVVPKAIRERAYDFVARTRYQIFGRHDRCLVPSPEYRSRFID